MKYLLKYIFSTILILVILDFSFGAVAKTMVVCSNLKGDFATIDYVVKSCNDDVVIIGNSMALYSTIPSVIKDSLNMSTWNCACNGQQLPYFESILECLFAHHKPKMILWGIGASGISSVYMDKRLKMLSLYYNMGYPTLDKYLEKSAKEKILMKSDLYRYNTIWVRMLLYYFVNSGEDGNCGFVAKPHPPYPPVKQYLNDEKEIPSPEAKRMFLHIVDMCKANNTQLILYITPVYQEYANGNSSQATYLKRVCADNDIVVLDYLQDSLFLSRPDLFYDNIHLNVDGAEIFTHKLIKDLKLLN